jgi:hypothetical protein
LLQVSRKSFKPLNIKVTEENQNEVLLKKICPFHKVSYPFELQVKQNNALRVVDALMARLKAINTVIPEFPVEEIIPSVSDMVMSNIQHCKHTTVRYKSKVHQIVSADQLKLYQL